MDFQETVRKCFAAYLSQDRKALELLLSDDFTFSSPDDPRLDKPVYFEKCWPFSKQVKQFDIQRLISDGNQGFVQYACETHSGRKFTNTEFFETEQGKVKKIEVYYGLLLHP